MQNQKIHINNQPNRSVYRVTFGGLRKIVSNIWPPNGNDLSHLVESDVLSTQITGITQILRKHSDELRTARLQISQVRSKILGVETIKEQIHSILQFNEEMRKHRDSVEGILISIQKEESKANLRITGLEPTTNYIKTFESRVISCEGEEFVMSKTKLSS